MIKNIEKRKNSFFLIFGLILVLLISTISAVTIKSATTDPSEVAPGETARITIEIENTLGEDVSNVNIALDLGSDIPIAPYQGSSEENLDELNEGDEEKFTFEVIVLPQASAGIYKIPIQIDYLKNGTKEIKNSTISLIVNSVSQLKVSAEGYLIKGKEGTIRIRIVNDGLSDLKFISVQTKQLSIATINSPLYEYLGNINSDDFETIEYSIYTESATDISIPVEIAYKDATNKDYTQKESLSVKVYSAEEAVKLGLVQKQSYLVPVLVAMIPLLYVAYRIRKRIKRKKASGA